MLLTLALLASAVVPGPAEPPERSPMELRFAARPMVGFDSGVNGLDSGASGPGQPAMAVEASAIVRSGNAGIELRLLPMLLTQKQQAPVFMGGYVIVPLQILGGELGPALGVQHAAPSVGWSYRIGHDSGLRLDLLTSVVFADGLDWGGMDVSVRGPVGGGISLVLRAGGGVDFVLAEGGVRIPAGAGVYLLPSLGFLKASWNGSPQCGAFECTFPSFSIIGPQLGLGVEWLR